LTSSELAVLRPFDRHVAKTVVDSSSTVMCSIHVAFTSYVVTNTSDNIGSMTSRRPLTFVVATSLDV